MSLISSNIPSIIFYGSSMSEFERIARSTLLLKGFLPVAKNLLDQISHDNSKHAFKADEKSIQKTSRGFSKIYYGFRYCG